MIRTSGFQKANGQIRFLKLLLSLENGNVASSFISCTESGNRRLEFSISLTMDEEFYQLCLDLALQKMINAQKTKGEENNGKRCGKTCKKKHKENSGGSCEFGEKFLLP
jgi:hypothetical protein